MTPHGNSLQSDKEHHLYRIYDKADEKTYKYGISGQPLNEDGTSPRASQQVALYNRVVGWFRFFGEVIKAGIPDREKALDLEQKYIDEHEQKYGSKPRGND